ncbi:hypothetical protein BHE74_00031519 [Ensete ventricosum]|nr:hypothetical protein BHE74_00031519 [Ensete ventricosum]
MAHHILTPHHYNWPVVRLGHARGDDRGKAECMGDLPSDVERSKRADNQADARALTFESEIPIPTSAGELAYSTGTSNPNSEHPSGFTHILPPTLQAAGQTPRFPVKEPNMATPTPNHYWRLLNDSGFTPPAPNPRHHVVSTEAFLGLT